MQDYKLITGEDLTENDLDKIKNIPSDPKYTDTAYTAGTNISISASNVISATDTITTINGKTGAISKADITALGIPSQDTVYKKPASEPISYIDGLDEEIDKKLDISKLTFIEDGVTYLGKFVIDNGQPKIVAEEVI